MTHQNEPVPGIIAPMPPAEHVMGDAAGVVIDANRGPAEQGDAPNRVERPLLHDERIAASAGTAALDGVHVTAPSDERIAAPPDLSANLGVLGGGRPIGTPIRHTQHQEPGMIIGRRQKAQ